MCHICNVCMDASRRTIKQACSCRKLNESPWKNCEYACGSLPLFQQRLILSQKPHTQAKNKHLRAHVFSSCTAPYTCNWMHAYIHTLSDPMSKPLYTCTLSALMTSPSSARATSRPTPVLPTAVGPVMMITLEVM